MLKGAPSKATSNGHRIKTLFLHSRLCELRGNEMATFPWKCTHIHTHICIYIYIVFEKYAFSRECHCTLSTGRLDKRSRCSLRFVELSFGFIKCTNNYSEFLKRRHSLWTNERDWRLWKIITTIKGIPGSDADVRGLILFYLNHCRWFHRDALPKRSWFTVKCLFHLS